MSNDSGDLSAAYAYTDAQISNLRSEINAELRQLEEEMAELARAVVAAINDQTETLARQMVAQTVAVVGGIATTTAMLERTKNQIESDFKETRGKLDLQTETELQVEVGKKVADASASKSKLDAFRTDIDKRANTSLLLIYQNRNLYNLHFRKIFEEYQHKLATIGEHIFRIRDVDLRPAVEAAKISPDQVHGLPMEVDLYRLKVRSENLDESLTLLKSSRLDDILSSTQRLESMIERKFAVNLPQGAGDAVAVGISIQSSIGADFVIAAEAKTVADAPVDIGAPQTDFAIFASPEARGRVRTALAQRKSRQATNEEIVNLAQAAARLQEKNLISPEAYVMFEDFLGQGTLQVVE
ncbi:MAG: hypothetical protein HY017_27570 [Betaproteobacteria bacterium]|nr:hypothetical protein [Betaproteobacteria bacterium]